MIGADGYRSIVRRYLNPDKPFADYAGYLVWVGKVDEELLPKKDWKKRQLSSAYFNNSAAGTLTTAVMPGIEGGTKPGHRWIGFCWFDHSHKQAQALITHLMMRLPSWTPLNSIRIR